MCRSGYIVLIAISWAVFTSCSSGSTENSHTENEAGSAPGVIDPASFGIDATAGVPEGLQVGTKAPGFAGRDNLGMSFDLYSELRQGPVVVLFYRGKWCPVCNRYMSNFNDSVKYILQRKARIVAITPELRANVNEFVEKTRTEFPVISDPTHTILDAFQVTFRATEGYQKSVLENHAVNIAENNGGTEAYLPVPAAYVIDQSGTIIYRHFDLDYHNRASVREILQYLR